MEEITKNLFDHDGMIRVRVLSDKDLDPERYIKAVPAQARAFVEHSLVKDEPLSLFTLDLCWPVIGAYEIEYLSSKGFRRLYFAHFRYAERVSECVRLAARCFEEGTGFAPRNAYVLSMPASADGVLEVHGCLFIEAEWMPANCVAVGGMR